MKKLIILSIFILSSGIFVNAHILPELEKVKEVKFIEYSREDVRKIFAGYNLEADDKRHEDLFTTENTEISVSYSEGLCADDESEGLNISEWKVFRISVSLKSDIKIKNAGSILAVFGIDFSKLKKERVYNDEKNIYLYHNKDLGIGLYTVNDEIETVDFQPARKYYSSLCDKKAAKKLSSTSSWFPSSLKERIYKVCGLGNNPPDIINVILSFQEITASCSQPGSTQNKSCSDVIKVITVFAVGKDPEGDVLTYIYNVSGGKITGYGAKVIWDLSDVKPGIYTITAIGDDGSGKIGKSMTKTVVVKECSNCTKKN